MIDCNEMSVSFWSTLILGFVFLFVFIYEDPNFPRKQAWPLLTGEFNSGIARIILSRLLNSRLIWHPTGHKLQIVFSTFVDFSHLLSLSTKAPTGQTSIQAPQNSHPDCMRLVPLLVPTRD